ncbi:MAG: methyltransferase domain-containing protein [Planctomycetales bacterium]|jgi:SAM-dependent methyltransferase|nr:methyltransferase domain-containing protein [Planctomycetales bacterium]
MTDSDSSISPELLSALRNLADGSALVLDADGVGIRSLDSKDRWRVIDGIPRFVSDQHLESFGHQWTTFEVAHDDEDRATFEAKTGIDLNQLRGMRVLDAGCGGGRYSKICGESGAVVIGADHTRAVDKARQLCVHLPDVHFVQADLKQLPLEKASFDFVFSIGVMHHDANTRAVFEAVAKMVKPGGRYSVWLYRRNQWWQELINTGLRALTSRLPAAVLMPFCHLGAILGSTPLVNRTLNKVVNFSAHPSYENRVCDTFDWWAPRFQYHHTVDELRGWFAEAGFSQLKELPPEKSGRFYRWAYENNLLIGSGVNITGIRQ